MSSTADQGLKKINSYDIFANIVPGLVFILGLLLPLHPAPVLKSIFGEEWTLSFGIAHLLLLVAVSFVFGQVLQGIGSRVDGDHGFPNLVRKIRGEDVECRYAISEFEDNFWDACSDKFDLSDEFDSYDRLFKAILADLEASGRRRALRMQALYLFSRGVVVALRVLAAVYVITAISLEYRHIPTDWTPLFRPAWLLLSGAVIAYVASLQVDKERKELEVDWIKYTLTEFYLETSTE